MPGSPLDPYTATASELQERIAADRAGAPYLAYRDGDGEQRIVKLDAGHAPFTIGRNPESELPLGWDAEVSSAHAQLEPVGGEWALLDDGLSRNGSFVNGERVHGRRRLRDGDAIQAGATVIVYRAPAEQIEETVPARAGDGPLVTDAQRRVLVALCRPFRDPGRFAKPATNREIAAELHLSVEAVKTHLRALFERFGVEHLPQNQKRLRLVELALETGVVSAVDLAREPG